MLGALWRRAHLEPCWDIQSPRLPLNQPSNIFAHVKKERDWSWIVRVKRKMETNKTDDHLCLSWYCVFRIADFICVFGVVAYDGFVYICIYIHYVYPVLNMLGGLRMWCVDICDMRIPCFLYPCPPLHTLGIWRLVLCSLSPLTVGSLDFWGFVSLLTFGWARVYKYWYMYLYLYMYTYTYAAYVYVYVYVYV